MRKFLALAILVGFGSACAITDYDGIPNHKTTGEAKFWGKGVAFTGFGVNLDGTYDYTVKYDNRAAGTVKIYSYRIPGIVSFNRDGLVDRDGDDVQGGSGDAGGKWYQWVRAFDDAPGTCEFDQNFLPPEAKMWANGDIGAALCISGFVEEIDKDFDLSQGFESLDDLFTSIWSGATGSDFALHLTGLTLNGVSVGTDVTLDMSHNGYRPINMGLDAANAAGLIEAILANTTHGAPTTIGFSFAGGMGFDAPVGLTVAFNHDALGALVQ